jgi:hypothetical protein
MKADLKLAGVYLYLFHGRRDPAEQMDDWGEMGPTLGPFQFVNSVAGSELSLGYDGEELKIVDGLVYYDGMWFGDWSVFSAHTFENSLEMKQRHEVFDQEKAKLPEKETGERADDRAEEVSKVQVLPG